MAVANHLKRDAQIEAMDLGRRKSTSLTQMILIPFGSECASYTSVESAHMHVGHVFFLISYSLYRLHPSK